MIKIKSLKIFLSSNFMCVANSDREYIRPFLLKMEILHAEFYGHFFIR